MNAEDTFTGCLQRKPVRATALGLLCSYPGMLFVLGATACFALQSNSSIFIFFPEHPSRVRTATPQADPAQAAFSGSLFFPVRVTQWRFNGHRPRKSVPQTPQRTCVSRRDHRGDSATPTGGPDPARELCSPRSEVTGTCCRACLPVPHPPAAPYAEDDHAEDNGDHPEEPGALEVAAAIADPLRAHRRRHPAGAAANRRSARRAPPPLRPPRGGRGRGGAAPSVTERRWHWSDRWRHLQRAGDAATGAAGAGEPCPAAGAPPGAAAISRGGIAPSLPSGPAGRPRPPLPAAACGRRWGSRCAVRKPGGPRGRPCPCSRGGRAAGCETRRKMWSGLFSSAVYELTTTISVTDGEKAENVGNRVMTANVVGYAPRAP